MLTISRAQRVDCAVSWRALTSRYLKILLLYSGGMAAWGLSGINPKLQISSVFPYQWPWMSQTSHRFASSFCQLHPSALVLSCQSWDKENHRDYIKAETWQVTDMQQNTSETISSWLQIEHFFSLNLCNCTAAASPETACSALQGLLGGSHQWPMGIFSCSGTFLPHL